MSEFIAGLHTLNGLFVLDLNTAPWGVVRLIHPFSFGWSIYLDASVIKAVCPAFWTVGGDWPTVRAQTFFLEICVLT